MKIALDHDGTYTLDPKMWDAFIKLAQQAGHDVVCVTKRYPSEPISLAIPVIYASRNAKLNYVASKDIKIDVWIDNDPFDLLPVFS